MGQIRPRKNEKRKDFVVRWVATKRLLYNHRKPSPILTRSLTSEAHLVWKAHLKRKKSRA